LGRGFFLTPKSSLEVELVGGTSVCFNRSFGLAKKLLTAEVAKNCRKVRREKLPGEKCRPTHTYKHLPRVHRIHPHGRIILLRMIAQRRWLVAATKFGCYKT